MSNSPELAWCSSFSSKRGCNMIERLWWVCGRDERDIHLGFMRLICRSSSLPGGLFYFTYSKASYRPGHNVAGKFISWINTAVVIIYHKDFLRLFVYLMTSKGIPHGVTKVCCHLLAINIVSTWYDDINRTDNKMMHVELSEIGHHLKRSCCKH